MLEKRLDRECIKMSSGVSGAKITPRCPYVQEIATTLT